MTSTKAYRLLLWMAGLFFLTNLALFSWGMNRGFDIKDEAFMLLCYRYPQEYATLTTSFHLIVDRLTGGQDLGVLGYRWMGFSLKLFSALVFSLGLWRFWLKLETEGRQG